MTLVHSPQVPPCKWPGQYTRTRPSIWVCFDIQGLLDGKTSCCIRRFVDRVGRRQQITANRHRLKFGCHQSSPSPRSPSHHRPTNGRRRRRGGPTTPTITVRGVDSDGRQRRRPQAMVRARAQEHARLCRQRCRGRLLCWRPSRCQECPDQVFG